jgi:hypothetical protein
MKSLKTNLGLRLLCTVLCASISSVGCFAQRSKSTPTPQKLFDFHSGFWINLHHFLYWQALSSTPQKGLRHVTLSNADEQELSHLSPDEHAAWNSAVSYYANSLIQRDLLFDQGMETIKNQLEDAETSDDLAGVPISPDLKVTLLKVGPIYRKHWWMRHDFENRQWIAQLQPLLDQYGSLICDSLVKIYEAPWPGYPVRVDAVVYANWAGAYTTLEPTRPTISTSDVANQATAALEIVFHEASHGMMGKVMDSIDAAEKSAGARGKSRPIHFRRDLWHEVLFYTSGQLVAEQVRGYTSYADKNGLWTRAWPGPDRVLIEQDWKPHMDGAVPLPVALAKLVDDLAMASSP